MFQNQVVACIGVGGYGGVKAREKSVSRLCPDELAAFEAIHGQDA